MTELTLEALRAELAPMRVADSMRRNSGLRDQPQAAPWCSRSALD